MRDVPGFHCGEGGSTDHTVQCKCLMRLNYVLLEFKAQAKGTHTTLLRYQKVHGVI